MPSMRSEIAAAKIRRLETEVALFQRTFEILLALVMDLEPLVPKEKMVAMVMELIRSLGERAVEAEEAARAGKKKA